METVEGVDQQDGNVTPFESNPPSAFTVSHVLFAQSQFGALDNAEAVIAIQVSVPLGCYDTSSRWKQSTLSTLDRANRRRLWRTHTDLAQRLIVRARTLFAEEDSG